MGTEWFIICHTCKEYADIHKVAPFLIQWSIESRKWDVFLQLMFDFIGKHHEHGIVFTNEHSILYENVEKMYQVMKDEN